MVGDRVDVLAPRSPSENEGVTDISFAIVRRNADINRSGRFALGHTSIWLSYMKMNTCLRNFIHRIMVIKLLSYQVIKLLSY